MSSKPRKIISRFVSDPEDIIQMSPRTDVYHHEGSPFAMANNSDSPLVVGPRATRLSPTPRTLEYCLDAQSKKNPFVVHSQTDLQAGSTIPIQTNLSNEPDRPAQRLSTGKRLTASRRFNRKPHPVFTPRRVENVVPLQFSDERTKWKVNAQTQTDAIGLLSSKCSCHNLPSLNEQNVGDVLENPRRQPLGVLAQNKYKDFSGLCCGLILFTAVYILFSIFFELDGKITEKLSNLLQYLPNWYRKEEPVTKFEMLVQCVKNLWP